MKENVVQGSSVKGFLHSVKLTLLVIYELLHIFIAVMLPVLVSRIEQVVCDIIGLPEPVAVNDTEIHSMADKLITVILVAK